MALEVNLQVIRAVALGKAAVSRRSPNYAGRRPALPGKETAIL